MVHQRRGLQAVWTSHRKGQTRHGRGERRDRMCQEVTLPLWWPPVPGSTTPPRCGDRSTQSPWSAAQEFGHAECQVEGLSAVEPGVTGGGVALVELSLHDLLDATQALGDVVPGH